MASPVLKVGGFNFSPFLRLQPDEGQPINPVDQSFFRPQFSGAAALGEGSSWVGDAVDNRPLVFPIYFTAATRAAIKRLVEEADQALVKGAQVEFNIDPDVEESSFFDLERGVLAQEFNFYHLVNMVAGAVLTLTARPYANTATHRLIASIPAATSAVVKFAATGISGDAYALANLEVRVGSQVASAGRVIAWGVHPHPSHNPYRAATSGLAQAGATVRGASGAVGSQYTAIPVSPTGASGIAYTAYLDPPDAHIGRHRVLAIGRSGLSAGIAMYGEDRFGAILGATALATQTDTTRWQLIDLGEINVPARASGQDEVPTQLVNIRAGAAQASGTISASPGLHLNGICFLPLDYSAGILRTKGTGQSPLFLDSLARWFGLGENQLLEELPAGEVGRWSPMLGTFRISGQAVGMGYPYHSITPGGLGGVPRASAIYSGASGAQAANVTAAVSFQMDGEAAFATKAAASAALTLWAPAITNGSQVVGGVGAKFQLGPSQFLALYSASSNGATAMKASAGIASTFASGVYTGQAYTLTMRVKEGRADVWLNEFLVAGLAASPVLSASSADLTPVGWFALAANQGSAEAKLSLANFSAYALGAGASDVAARETFRFEAHPESRVYQGTASAFVRDRLADYRGQFPKLPPVPTSATGPARVIVLQGEVANFQGLDGPDIALSVLERYRFLR